MPEMIDHVSLPASDLAASRAFYSNALAPLGYEILFEEASYVGFGVPPKPEFFLIKSDSAIAPLHVAFSASKRALVDSFYASTMASGGRDNGKPAVCPEYHPNYYGGFVFDPDGHNIEAVCHTAEP
jgi:catechol 2,3-dioxygenase-like lactoylglutathione lyase family enzyme